MLAPFEKLIKDRNNKFPVELALNSNNTLHLIPILKTDQFIISSTIRHSLSLDSNFCGLQLIDHAKNKKYFLNDKQINCPTKTSVISQTDENINVDVSILQATDEDKQTYVCKTSIFQGIKRSRSLREIELFKEINHPNIIKQHAHMIYFDEDMYCYVFHVMEEGTPFKEYFSNKISYQQYKEFATDLCNGLMYLHSQNIIHRDIKPDNVLIVKNYTQDKGWIAKIIDFDINVKLKTQNEICSERAGTPPFIAPEIIVGEYNYRCDIYSFGKTLEDISKQYLRADMQQQVQLLIANLTNRNPIQRMPLQTVYNYFRQVDQNLIKMENNQMYKYIVAIDIGTTTLAYAIRNTNNDYIMSASMNQDLIKSSSEIHFFLQQENEELSIQNSQLGPEILQQFKNDKYKFHYCFFNYKLKLFNKDNKTIKAVSSGEEIDYPSLKISPENSNKAFKLFEIYQIVIQHISESIKKYFNEQNIKFNVNDIVWVVTVPSFATQDQKDFIQQAFKYGMGKFNGEYIHETRIEIMLESQAGFIYSMLNPDKQGKIINEQCEEPQTAAIFNFGGGSLELTAAKFQRGKEPEILMSEFVAEAGGQDVDKNFMKIVENITGISKLNIPDMDKQILLSTIRHNFQQKKHEYFGSDTHQKHFIVPFVEVFKYISADTVKQMIQKEFEYNPDDPDVSVDDQNLKLKMDFAKEQLLYPVRSLFIVKTVELLFAAKNKCYQISSGIAFGGFASCQSLIGDIKSQFNFDLKEFDHPALVVVNGATLFDKIKIIKRGVGLEVVTQIKKLSYEYQTLANSPQFKQFKVGKDKTCAGILPIFPTNQAFTKDMEFPRTFKPERNSTEITIILHIFEAEKKIPEIYAHEQSIMNLNKVQVECSMGLSVKIPQNIADIDRELTIKFQYKANGDQINVHYKWKNEDNFTEKALQAKPVGDLSSRLIRIEPQPWHFVFVIDRSDSMYAQDLNIGRAWPSFLATEIDQEWENHPHKYQHYVGAIFVLGLNELIKARKRALGSRQQEDRYTIIVFDDTAELICSAQQIVDESKLFNFLKSIDVKGNTQFAPPLQLAVEQASKSNLSSCMIFLTDGDEKQDLRQNTFAHVKNIRNAFKDNCVFINFGTDGANVQWLADKFDKVAKDIKDNNQITEVFLSFSVAELM